MKYLRHFPLPTNNEDHIDPEELSALIDVEMEDPHRNLDKVVDFEEIYYKMFEEKCDFMHPNPQHMVLLLPLAKNATKEMIRMFKVNVNGHCIDRTEFFIKEHDEILIEVPRAQLVDSCQRRLFQYLFGLLPIRVLLSFASLHVCSNKSVQMFFQVLSHFEQVTFMVHGVICLIWCSTQVSTGYIIGKMIRLNNF